VYNVPLVVRVVTFVCEDHQPVVRLGADDAPNALRRLPQGPGFKVQD
jgi:hypothetical protein